MTAAEAIAHLEALGSSSEPVEYFLFLAANVHELRLTDGRAILGKTELVAFLAEWQRAMEQLPPAELPFRRMFHRKFPRFGSDYCHACGHVHKGGSECGEDMGGGKTCRCEEAVTA